MTPNKTPACRVAIAFAAAEERAASLVKRPLPFLVCMMASAICGHYHRVADALAGILAVAAGFFVGHWVVAQCSGRENQ